jgi:rod shape-determining protein MreB
VPIGPLDRAFNQDIALDPGSEHCRVMAGPTEALVVPSLVARIRPGYLPFMRGEAVGLQAREVALRSQRDETGRGGVPGVELIRPIRRGAIADAFAAERLFAHIFREAPGRRWGARPRVLCGIGPGVTPAQQRTMVDALDRGGAKRIKLVPALSACVLALKPVDPSTVRLIVEFGAECTGIGIASCTGVVKASSLPLGSFDLDRVLAGSLRRRGLAVGIDRATALREGLGLPTVGSDSCDDGEPLCDVEDVLPRHVGAALGPFVRYIADEVIDVMSRAPEGAASDIVEGGIVLAGAPAATPGIAETLAADIGIAVACARFPDTLRVRGLVKFLLQPDLLDEAGVEA